MSALCLVVIVDARHTQQIADAKRQQTMQAKGEMRFLNMDFLLYLVDFFV
jgi:hypothetical protein